jgi:hypothetical protein
MVSMMDQSTSEGMRELQVNKMKYCMHKDDIVIGLGRCLYADNINVSTKKAYPSVISTIGGTSNEVKRFMAVHNFMVNCSDDAKSIKNDFEKHLKGREKDPRLTALKVNQIVSGMNHMMEFYFVGVSLGLAYAHSHSGDTVASVMVGGLKTVLNGGFQVINDFSDVLLGTH